MSHIPACTSHVWRVRLARPSASSPASRYASSARPFRPPAFPPAASLLRIQSLSFCAHSQPPRLRHAAYPQTRPAGIPTCGPADRLIAATPSRSMTISPCLYHPCPYMGTRARVGADARPQTPVRPSSRPRVCMYVCSCAPRRCLGLVIRLPVCPRFRPQTHSCASPPSCPTLLSPATSYPRSGSRWGARLCALSAARARARPSACSPGRLLGCPSVQGCSALPRALPSAHSPHRPHVALLPPVLAVRTRVRSPAPPVAQRHDLRDLVPPMAWTSFRARCP